VGTEAALLLGTFGIEVPMSEIYLSVVFPKLEIPGPELERVPEKDR